MIHIWCRLHNYLPQGHSYCTCTVLRVHTEKPSSTTWLTHSILLLGCIATTCTCTVHVQCICMYMYMYVHVYVCTCICMYMYMYVHVYVCTCICMYMCTVHTQYGLVDTCALYPQPSLLAVYIHVCASDSVVWNACILHAGIFSYTHGTTLPSQIWLPAFAKFRPINPDTALEEEVVVKVRHTRVRDIATLHVYCV